MMQNKYLDILNNLTPVNLTMNSRVLVVDGLNNFIRAWSTNPILNDDGVHCGGITGFLMTLGYAIKQINPTRVIIVFDGSGGSMKRREIYSEYKNNRTPGSPIKRSFDSGEDQQYSMTRQISKLIQYLNVLPITTIIIDKIEADDTIAYLSKLVSEKEGQTYIMSTDKDFLQLVSNNVIVWSPTKRKMYFRQDILDEYNISPENYLLYRVLTGDKSDNIPGIRGIGIKTLIKKVPHISLPTEISLESLFEFCNTNYKDTTLSSILKSKDIIERNYKLMQLKDVNISGINKTKIMSMFDTSPNLFDKREFIKLLIEDKMLYAIKNVDVWSKNVFLPISGFINK